MLGTLRKHKPGTADEILRRDSPSSGTGGFPTVAERLFVYGTLGPGGPNEHVLSQIEGNWEPGWVRGRLRHLGWGAEMGYPAIVLDERADPVLGHIFVSEKLADHWRELDAFEGEEYGRVTTTVHLADQRTVKAFIYVLREGV